MVDLLTLQSTKQTHLGKTNAAYLGLMATEKATCQTLPMDYWNSCGRSHLRGYGSVKQLGLGYARSSYLYMWY